MDLRDLETFLLKKFKPNSDLLDFSTEKFLPPRERALSEVLKVFATVKKSDEEKLIKLNLIVKFLKNNFQKIRAIHLRTFDTEILFYEKIAPIYDQLLADVFPDKKEIYPGFFSARLSLNEEAKFRDDDTAILLQDLGIHGYHMSDKRLEGLDHARVNSVLDSMALFHSLGFIARQISPDFHSSLKFVRKPVDYSPKLSNQVYRDQFCKVFSKLPQFREYRAQIAEMLADNLVIDYSLGHAWNTIVHSDLETTNIVFGADDHAILLDYQLLRFASPLKDLLFFLITSVELDFGHCQVERAMEFYLERLNLYLEKGGLVFSRQKFDNRLKLDAKEEFMKIVLALYYLMQQDGAEREDEESFYFRRVKRMLDLYVWKKWFN